MSREIVRPIYDIKTRILDFNIYPYITGRVFFDTVNQIIYTDIDGQRAARTDLSSIQVLDGNIQEFYERGAKGFENQIMVGKTPTGFRLYYVDNEAQVHNLTFTAESISSLNERGITESATFYYAGEWKANKEYTADDFRIAVVKYENLFYYAKVTSSSANFNASNWIRFSAQFESVATGLLLAEDAVIRRTLTMGEETIDQTTFQGTIKSASVDSLDEGVGFFLGNEDGGVFRVGDPEGNFIRWNGSDMTIQGTLRLSTNLIFNNQIFRNSEYGVSVINLASSGATIMDQDILKFYLKSLNRANKTVIIEADNFTNQEEFGTATLTLDGPLGEDGEENQFWRINLQSANFQGGITADFSSIGTFSDRDIRTINLTEVARTRFVNTLDVNRILEELIQRVL